MLRTLQTADAKSAALRTDTLRSAVQMILKPLLSFCIMFLLMHAETLGSIAPFAPAFLCSALSAGLHPAFLCIGCMVGMLRFPLSASLLTPAIGCALALSGELALSFVPMRKRSPEIRCAILSGVSVMLPALFFAGGEALPSIQAICASVMASASAPFFLMALQIGAKRKQLTIHEKLGVFLLLAGAIGGLEALSVHATEFACCLCVLALHPRAVEIGVICGLGRMAGGATEMALASSALLGFVSGLKLYRHRWQRSVCVALMCFAELLAQAKSPYVLIGSLAAALIYALIPEKALNRLSAYFTETEANDADRIAREICEESGKRLTSLAEAFGEMAQSCAATEALPDEQALISEMRERLCGGCAEYSACWNGDDNHAVHFLCALISEALDRVDAPTGKRVIFSDGEIPPEIMRFCRRGRMIPDRLGLLLRDFAEKRRSVIKRSVNNRNFGVQLAQAREILYAAAERQAAPVCLRGERLHRLEAALDLSGIRDCEVSATDIEHMEIRLMRSSGEWHTEEVRRASRAFSQAFGGGFAAYRRDNCLYFVRKPRFQAHTGVSCRAGKAGEVCGDSHLLRMLHPTKLAVMLSDGMGSGENAAHESAETLRLLWRFLSAGLSRSLAIETVNQHMLMRSGDEIYATVDLLLLDLNAGIAEFSKLAACRTLILRGNEILRIDAGNLPLGILEGVQPMIRKVRLKAGDMIVLASDGVMDSCDEAAMNRFLRSHAASAPETLAEEIVHEAALRREAGRSDDMTCICVRIEEVSRRKK